jgi:hypothetical protein
MALGGELATRSTSARVGLRVGAVGALEDVGALEGDDVVGSSSNMSDGAYVGVPVGSSLKFSSRLLSGRGTGVGSGGGRGSLLASTPGTLGGARTGAVMRRPVCGGGCGIPSLLPKPSSRDLTAPVGWLGGGKTGMYRDGVPIAASASGGGASAGGGSIGVDAIPAISLVLRSAALKLWECTIVERSSGEGCRKPEWAAKRCGWRAWLVMNALVRGCSRGRPDDSRVASRFDRFWDCVWLVRATIRPGAGACAYKGRVEPSESLRPDSCALSSSSHALAASGIGSLRFNAGPALA